MTINDLIPFRNRLSKQLLSFGLQKKRFNDGYYYYGLVHKTNEYTSENIEEYIVFRENLEKKYYLYNS